MKLKIVKQEKNRELYKRRCNNGRSRKKCYEYLELVNQENKKKHLTQQKNETKKERQLLVDLFKDEGLTEEDVLNKMSTKNLYKKPYKIYFEKSMVKMKKIQKLNQKRWERQKNNLNKKTFYRTLRKIQRFCMEQYGWTLTEVRKTAVCKTF